MVALQNHTAKEEIAGLLISLSEISNQTPKYLK